MYTRIKCKYFLYFTNIMETTYPAILWARQHLATFIILALLIVGFIEIWAIVLLVQVIINSKVVVPRTVVSVNIVS